MEYLLSFVFQWLIYDHSFEIIIIFQFHLHKQDHNEHNVFIDYICGATLKSIISNGLVFYAIHITFKRLIINEYVAYVARCLVTLFDVVTQIFNQRTDNDALVFLHSTCYQKLASHYSRWE